MTTVRPRSEPVLNEKWAAFIQSGLAICVASRDPQNVPRIVRGFGCRVTGGNKQRITVLVAASQADLFLEAVRETGTIAATFTQPSTHTSVQVKGVDAAVSRPRAPEGELTKVNLDRFVEDAGRVGYPEDVLRAVFWSEPADLIAITFSPIAAFLQTPGPRAGQALS